MLAVTGLDKPLGCLEDFWDGQTVAASEVFPEGNGEKEPKALIEFLSLRAVREPLLQEDTPLGAVDGGIVGGAEIDDLVFAEPEGSKRFQRLPAGHVGGRSPEKRQPLNVVEGAPGSPQPERDPFQKGLVFPEKGKTDPPIAALKDGIGGEKLFKGVACSDGKVASLSGEKGQEHFKGLPVTTRRVDIAEEKTAQPGRGGRGKGNGTESLGGKVERRIVIEDDLTPRETVEFAEEPALVTGTDVTDKDSAVGQKNHQGPVCLRRQSREVHRFWQGNEPAGGEEFEDHGLTPSSQKESNSLL
jgi:hypothetical protein